MTVERVSRRTVLGGLAAAFLLFEGLPAAAQGLPNVAVSKDPACGCCGGWVDHLKAAGYAVQVHDTADLDGVKRRLGVPVHLAACHTAEVAGYVIEGHVPAAAIMRLLAEKPAARGLAVPGMPVGSPGMEVQGVAPEAYDVLLFAAEQVTVFGRYRGTARLV